MIRNIFRGHLFCLSLACTFVYLLACYFFIDTWDYNRWDNFEYYTPTITETHRLWWTGHIPFWSPFQHMGEPLLGNGQPGALYFPYTLTVGLMLLFGLKMALFPLLTILLHMPFMIWAWARFLKLFEVSSPWAVAGGFLAATSGVIVCYQSVWIFTFPYLTLLPFLIWASTEIILFHRSKLSPYLMVFLSISLMGWLGHPQFLFYTCFTGAVFSVILLLVSRSRPINYVSIGLTYTLGALGTMPALFPIYEIYKETLRQSSFDLKIFLEASLRPETLVGLVNPLVDGYSVTFDGPMVWLFSAPWVLPLCLFGVFYARSWGPVQCDKSALTALFFTGLLFLVFSLGPYGGLLPLTHGLPVWSSFRWPHKFSPYALSLIIIAASFAGDRLRLSDNKNARLIILALLLFPILTPFISPPEFDLYLALFLLSVAASVPTLLAKNPWIKTTGLALACFSASLLTVKIAHTHVPKRYLEEYGSITSPELDMKQNDRVLSLSFYDFPKETNQTFLQEYSNFQMATANHYEAATGHTSPLAVKWYLDFFPANAWGIMGPKVNAYYISNDFFQLWGITHLIISKKDFDILALINALPQWRMTKELETTLIFKASNTNPKFFFAGKILPYSSEQFANHKSSLSNLDFAFVDNYKQPANAATGIVLRSQVVPGGEINLTTEAPAPGRLLINYTYFPQWRAFVNGLETPVEKTNGLVMSIAVPKGKNEVTLLWDKTSLLLGFSIFWISLFLLAIFWLYLHKTKNMAHVFKA